ncbi:MAG: hypothetical protein R3B47_15425 [Bacteroidia bacterium]
MGLIVGALVFASPDFLADIETVTKIHFPEEYASSGIKLDLMIPVFILKYLPHGLIGVLMVGIMSAAMSSSALPSTRFRRLRWKIFSTVEKTS